jgi:HEAT repeat protein
MLLEPETSDMARYALETLPAAEADDVLISALKSARGSLRAGIVASIGQRRSAGAVPVLNDIRIGSDRQAAATALTAMGQSADARSAPILIDALERLREPLKSIAASALLRCAEIRMAGNLPSQALILYDRVLRAGVPPSLRRAAFCGKIGTSRGEAPRLIRDALSGPDTALYEPAISLVPASLSIDDLPFLLRRFSDLPALSQRQLLAVLACFPAREILPAVTGAAASRHPQVRVEALRVLEKVGDRTTVPFLAERAARARGEEQSAARSSLWGIRADGADPEILNRLGGASPDIRAELIRAVAERRIVAGKIRLLDFARSSDAGDRLASIRGLRILAGVDDFVPLVNLLPIIGDEIGKEELENTIAAVALKSGRPELRAATVRGILAHTRISRDREPLIRILGKIGDDGSLPLLRQFLDSGDAGLIDSTVRALADWPTVTVRDDLTALARSTALLTHRILSVRALVRLIGLESFRRPQAAVESLREVLSFAGRAEEQRLILGLLPDFPCPEALRLAESLAADAKVGPEARASVERIRERLIHP